MTDMAADMCRAPGCPRDAVVGLDGFCELCKLSAPQLVVLNAVSHGENPKESLKTLRGYNDQRASQELKQIIETPELRAGLRALMERAGIDQADPLRKMKQIMDSATKEYCANGEVIPGGPDTKMQLEAAKALGEILIGPAPKEVTEKKTTIQGVVHIPAEMAEVPESEVVVLEDEPDAS